MKLSTIDYAFVCLAQLAASPLRWMGQFESAWLRDRLEDHPIENPVFITGLARSGTTILLEQLSRTNYFATHQYRDFPFLTIPWAWNRYLDLTTRQQPPIERPHRDRIAITAESPEAFEEPIWQAFFPDVHHPQRSHRLSAETVHQEFETFFRDHLRKLLFLRQRDRYLSKGNYNLTRIEYLHKLFPDALFVVPVRNPLDHIASLVKQHRLFCSYAKEDPRVGHYLACAGHYEFGPQRRAIRISAADGDRTDRAWQQGEEHLGYAIQWSQVYRLIDELRYRGDELSTRIHVVRYEDFCEDPQSTLASILSHAELSAGPLVDMSFDDIAPPSPVQLDTVVREKIWRETCLVAELYGYQDGDGSAAPARRKELAASSQGSAAPPQGQSR